MEETTTALIYKRDAAALEKRFGKPIRKALRLWLGDCPHPEDKRVPTTATVSTHPGEPINVGVPEKQVPGFWCKKCKRYIIG